MEIDPIVILPIASVVGGLVTYLIMFMTGSTTVNLSLQVMPQRIQKDDETDLLRIRTKAIKGQNGSIVVYQLGYRLLEGQETLCVGDFPGIYRLKDDNKRIEWETRQVGKGVARNPFLRITPEETLRSETYIEIPRNKIITVEVALIGKKDFSPFTAQWRTTSISFPCQKLKQ